MVDIVHTADTHLGYRQYHKDERRDDFRDAFQQVITAAIDADVDAVVHAGDLFHDSRPGIRAIETVLTELKRLDEAGIPFLTIVGNHDGTRDREWVEMFEELDLAIRLDDRGYQLEGVSLYGLDHVSQARRDDLDYRFSPCMQDHAILVAHGLFTPFDHGNWDTERLLAESNVGFDAILAGDDHEPKQARVGDTIISYSGSTERTATDQRQPRSYSLVSIDDDIQISRRALDTRPFEYVDLELGPEDGLEFVRAAIRQRDVEDTVLKVTLEPASEVAGDPDSATFEPIPEGPIQEFGNEQGALVTRVTDARTLAEDEREYREVEFADVDTVVRERLGERDIDPLVADLTELAMDTGQVAKSNVQDRAKETALDRTDGTGTSNGRDHGDEQDIDQAVEELATATTDDQTSQPQPDASQE